MFDKSCLLIIGVTPIKDTDEIFYTEHQMEVDGSKYCFVKSNNRDKTITDQEDIVKLAKVGDYFIITGYLEQEDSILRIIDLKITIVPDNELAPEQEKYAKVCQDPNFKLKTSEDTSDVHHGGQYEIPHLS